MNTKNTIIAGLLATGMLFTANVNAEEAAAEVAKEETPVVVSAALEAKEFAFTKAPESKETKDTRVTLTWDALDDALGYIVSYGETSLEKSNGEVEFYDKETEDLIESNETTIDGLTVNTTYYFVVTAIDKNGNETKFSPELELKTAETGAAVAAAEPKAEEETPAVEAEPKAEAAALEIAAVEASLNNQIKIKFNKALENSADAVREFKVLEKVSQIELNISKVTLEEDSMTLSLDLAGVLKTNAEYDVTVIALNAQDGTNIEAGVEGMRSFTTPWELKEKEEEAAPAVVEPEVDLNAAPAAKPEAKKLPQTGAEEVVVLFLALILSGLVFMRRKA